MRKTGCNTCVWMHVALAVCGLATWPRPAGAQSWTPVSGGTGIYYNGGNVGIGTASPGRLLHLTAYGQPGFAMSDTSGAAGNRSMGFVYDGGIALSKPGFVIQDFVDSGAFSANRHTFFKDGSINFGGITAPPTGVVAFTGGRVGIGTTNPQYLLSVEGTLGTKEVIVTNTGWSDYVFERDYRLRPLNEVKEYIQANHHLPDIPSAMEVKERGVSVGEMQSKLLANRGTHAAHDPVGGTEPAFGTAESGSPRADCAAGGGRGRRQRARGGQVRRAR